LRYGDLLETKVRESTKEKIVLRYLAEELLFQVRIVVKSNGKIRLRLHFVEYVDALFVFKELPLRGELIAGGKEL